MKKAELSIEQIGMIILLIAAFAIMLFVYWQFNWKPTIDRETCHSSVLMKASTPVILDSKAIDIPLRCKTNKICISESSNGKCSEFSSGVVEVKKVNTEDDIKRIIAESLYECWWMMGEGKVDIFSREFNLQRFSVKCVECSRIAFSDEIKAKYPNGITGFYKFLMNENIQGTDITYEEYLFGRKGQMVYDKQFQDIDKLSVNISYSNIFLEYDRTNAPEISGTVLGAIGLPALVAYFAAPVAKFLGPKGMGVLAVTGGAAGNWIGGLIGSAIGEKYIASWIILPARKSGQITFSYIVGNVKKYDADPQKDYCYAKSLIKQGYGGQWYALKKATSKIFMASDNNGSPGTFNELDISTLSSDGQDFVRGVASELSSVCDDLANLECSWESYA